MGGVSWIRPFLGGHTWGHKAYATELGRQDAVHSRRVVQGCRCVAKPFACTHLQHTHDPLLLPVVCIRRLSLGRRIPKSKIDPLSPGSVGPFWLRLNYIAPRERCSDAWVNQSWAAGRWCSGQQD